VSVVTNSERIDEAAPAARPGKRERLVSAASELVYRQGVARTTLADIAEAADVPLGNVYYYFKTKDDIVGAVLRTRTDEVVATLTDLDHRHRSPKARLKGLMGVLAERADTTALYGCPYGTLSTELAKRAEGPDPLVAPHGTTRRTRPGRRAHRRVRGQLHPQQRARPARPDGPPHPTPPALDRNARRVTAGTNPLERLTALEPFGIPA
jgi:AcrR family transcriptional regulator